MSVGVAVDQVRCAAANTVVIDSVYHRLFYLWMVSQPEIIITSKTDDVFIINDHFDLLRTICYAASSITELLLSLGKCFTEVFQKKS